ncbi:DUF4350 domain-containing protein [Isoptericola chiayiensis]|uniref:DUF4350 domain-containing protein n=1 Tax=Isoptericola chiayiensis TaxID=579446 RepID=A0ABP8Y610_9MICO|nr:DUF4350 domain-containing protein [Isoptericola chiayiensis]NOV99286.1 hypothetical protein [Isoptericola chiayiensis]
MTATVTWTSDPATDATTASRRRLRRHRARWVLVAAASLLLVVAVLLVTRSPGSTADLDPGNTRPNGSQAVARVLEQQGVTITHVTRVADALAAAGPDSTLLVTPSPFLLPEQADALAGTDADLVLAGAGRTLLTAATGAQVETDPLIGTPPEARPPGCELPAAVAAGPLVLEAGLVAVGDAVTTCWPSGDAAALAAVEQDGRQVTAVHDPSLLRNDTVADEGNAALALHLLGAHERLVWLVQDPTDLTAAPDGGRSGVEPDPAGVLPDWFGAALAWAALVALATVLWRGRRLGRLVAEDLPVVVPAAESTRGRARLYRRSRARGHAAAALRAATADRIAHRLGLPRAAGAPDVVDAVVRASGRHPDDVGALLYGPPPADDAELQELARRLDTLESEVHRP